jgi:hypothetical protein
MDFIGVTNPKEGKPFRYRLECLVGFAVCAECIEKLKRRSQNHAEINEA